MRTVSAKRRVIVYAFRVQSAESRRDFIHKLGICLKELRETRTWLKFMREMDLASVQSLAPVMSECDELLAILATSIKTARANTH